MLDFKTACLSDILSHKTMYYDEIDFSIVKKSWDILSKYIKIPFIIHIVGTNGKGSTGRFLAHYLHKKSFKILHYSSPHILKFNERIWINGKDSLDFELNYASRKIQKYLPLYLLEKLTYFEYTTLLALVLSDGLDYLVLEAGLGGEFDATNVVPADISLITTIGLDHQNFLGNSIKEIAKTKMRAADKKMFIGYQVFDEVYDVAKEVKKELKEEFDRDILIKKVENFEESNLNKKFPLFLRRNLHLVIETLKELGIEIDEKLFDDVKLFGRCQKIASNITVDVGHNPLAAQVLLKEFENKKVSLIYNSYKDKDYKEVLKILKPIISEIRIIDLDDKRVVDKNNLLDICNKLNIIINTNNEISDDKEYLVFGSFLVVEKFLKDLSFDEK
ncbi:bifunctional folylpolyglutamate synthase/dihydrofolate synthase [Halarcobacter anaerophilus]|uniref:Bifunctional folylpolyglutamate synthase/dihydrofolate synthase n=1 Tax=Halarcobacter anaerophilus TaxID=877500 RepID=A0A4Q0XXZ4_9BACT|nr:Mur ligase family protein [Halarcobacter anaerophilus]QDF28076.1 bifunctional folypolyglutamate synthetase / dihydrofolate synthetase [Halarcobacter anaerophilus]RXJ62422.1 bifunctional folylpolyglutamate synthase/dihydrofolate synthase [Halarcobacter anaerophilus]